MLKFLLNFIPGIGPIMSAIATIATNVFQFVLQHWKFFAIAALVGTIAYQNFSATRFVFGLETIPHEQVVIKQKDDQIVELKADLAKVVTANQNLTTSIGALNTTVGDWKQKSDELEAQNKALQGKLDQMRVETDKKVQDILNMKTPATCKDSIDFLRIEREKLTW